jgi:hypothetical protein
MSRVGSSRTRSHAPHLVAAFDHDAGTVLGRLATAARCNEIPAALTLLAGLDLRVDGGVVVTVDALCRGRHKASCGVGVSA